MRSTLRYALAAAVLLSVGCNDNTTSVTITPLPAPSSISSISLDSAIFLDWTDNAFLADPLRFGWYNVYSDSFDLDNNVCVTGWALEGTTVAPEFIAGKLPNGVPRCFAVSAVSVEGIESAWSDAVWDAPRPDGRNVLDSAFAVGPAHSGFRFWDDLNGDGYGDAGELGLVQDGGSSDNDFVVHLNASDSTLWIVPVFGGTQLQLYSANPIADLTSINYAPASGYSRDSLLARPGFGYVFKMVDASGLHYGALRMTHVGRQYVIFDWSVQTDPGDPQLAPPRQPAFTGKRVAANR